MSPLDAEALLGRFEKVRPDGAGWKARCPAHVDNNPSLKIDRGDGGEWLLFCHAGCAFENVVRAAGIDPRDLFPDKENGSRRGTPRPTRSGGPRPMIGGRVVPGVGSGTSPGATNAAAGLTLLQYAAHLKLPIEFLEGLALRDGLWYGLPAVVIPYYDVDGSVVRERFRIALTGARFRWGSGDRIVPYGLDRLADARQAEAIVIVEGESDCHTLWYHGNAAIGCPGAKTWRDSWASYLDGIPSIYVVEEGDSAGGRFTGAICR